MKHRQRRAERRAAERRQRREEELAAGVVRKMKVPRKIRELGKANRGR